MSNPDIPKGIEAQANRVVDDLINSLKSIQPAYRGVHGHYWQGVRMPLTIPADRGKLKMEKNQKPSDQEESWFDVGVKVPDTSLVSVAVHTYDGPNGQGYEVEGRMESGGSLWQRVAHTGVENWREQDWIEVEEGGNKWQRTQERRI